MNSRLKAGGHNVRLRELETGKMGWQSGSAS